MVKPTKTAALLAPKTATPRELAEDLAAPNTSLVSDISHTGQVRKAVDDLISSDLTPTLAMRAMRAARDLSDVPFFVRTAMEALRRDPNLQSVIQTRVLAVCSLPLVAEQAGKKLQDRKATEAAQEVLESEAVESVVPHLLLNGVYLGFGIAQNFIDTSVQPWGVSEITDVSPAFVTFDKADGRTPYLYPQNQGEGLQPLPYGKFIFHRPGLIAGNPATSGIAYAALFYYTLKNLALKDWVGFVELYGQPIRVGKYPQGLGATAAGKKDLEVLKRALRDLGGDAWAMLPDSMKVEFVEAASRNSSAEVYERLCRFLDEQLAKLVLGGSLTSGTGNTGSGGSQGLGVVHNELRADILKADAKALATTLRRYLIKPLTQWNFGPGVAVPKVYFQVEEAEDVAAKVKAICDLTDRGFKVPAAELYALLDIREPEGDEEVIGGTPAAAGTEGLTVKLSADNSNADELDALIAELQAEEGYALAEAQADEALLAAIEQATDAETLKKALMAAVRTGKVDGLQAVFTAGATAARVAGDVGVIVGGK